MTTVRPATLLLLPLLALPLALTGCVERRIQITSEPSGAMVWLNDQQIGRTPTEAAFTYHGVYDVRLELSGYEPLRTEAEAKAPLYENAPIDLFAEALPTEIHNTQKWHFVLHPALETELPKDELEQGLMERAGEMRTELESTAPGADQPAEEQTRAGDADTGGGRGAD